MIIYLLFLQYHARFSFDSKDEKNEIGNYTLTDLGSRNGTYVDGKRLSNALQESEPEPLLHDCSVRVGGTVLLCHIHPGRETCSQCEPGLLLSQQGIRLFLFCQTPCLKIDMC